MKNILNIDTKTTPYLLGYANERNNDNIITMNFITSEKVTDPYIEITKIDGTTENIAIEENSTNISFAIFQVPGTVKVRLISNEFNSEYINIVILEEIGLYDNAIVKLQEGNYIVRKVKTKTSGETYEFITSDMIKSLFK